MRCDWVVFVMTVASYCLVWVVLLDLALYREQSSTYALHTYIRSVDAEVQAAAMCWARGLLDAVSSMAPVTRYSSALALIFGMWRWYRWIEG